MKKLIYLIRYQLSVIVENDLIKGVFYGHEARKKYEAMNQFFECMVFDDGYEIYEHLKRMEFHPCITTHPLYHWIEKSRGIEITDGEHCDGTGSIARSCDERNRYYYKVGMEEFYGSYKRIYLPFFILNHITFFGPKAKEVFFGDFAHARYESASSDVLVSVPLFEKKMRRYTNINFKGPAFYVRSVINNFAH